MKSIFCGLIFALLTFYVGHSQIAGRVTNTETNEPIEEVQIQIPQRDFVAFSNAEGAFELKNTGDIPFTIVVSRLGYKTQQFMVTSTNITIELSPSVFEMEEVVVSSPFGNLENQNTIAVAKINSENIQESGASVLADAIQQIPGVSAISSGPGIAKPVIRGLSGNRVVTFSNDLRLENYQFGAEHGLDIGTTAKSVEVIKGPYSLLYGSDAVGGVVYVTPQDFIQNNSLTGDIQQRYFSQSMGNETSASVGIAADKWQFGANGFHSSHADYESSVEEFVPNSGFNTKGAGFNTRYSDGNYQATMRFSYADKQAGIIEEKGGVTRDFGIDMPYQETQLNQLSLRQKLDTSIGLWDMTVGMTLNQRREFEDHDAHGGHDEHDDDHDDEHDDDHNDEHEAKGAAALNMHNRVLAFDLKNALPSSGIWKQIAGFQWLEKQNKNSGEEILIPDAIQRDFGGYWLHQFDSDKLKWQIGLRYDSRYVKTESFVTHHHEEEEEEGHEEEHEEEETAKIDKTFSSFNSSVGFTYPLTEKIQARLNASTGYRAPNLAELTSHGVHHGTQRFEVGNANLKSERNLQFDFGFDMQTTNLNIGIDGFYNAITDYIFLNPTNETEDGVSVFEYEQSNARLWGGEFYAHYHPKGKIHFETTLEYVNGEQKDGTPLPLIPPFSFNQEVHWSLSESFAAFISLTMADNQNRVSPFESRTSAYELINIGGHIDIPVSKIDALRLQLLVRNFGNRNYIPHLSRLKTIGVEQPGRNFVLSAKYNF